MIGDVAAIVAPPTPPAPASARFSVTPSISTEAAPLGINPIEEEDEEEDALPLATTGIETDSISSTPSSGDLALLRHTTAGTEADDDNEEEEEEAAEPLDDDEEDKGGDTMEEEGEAAGVATAGAIIMLTG